LFIEMIASRSVAAASTAIASPVPDTVITAAGAETASNPRTAKTTERIP